MTRPDPFTEEQVDSCEIVYITKYFGKLDSGIAFADRFYLAALARSPMLSLVYGNRLPDQIASDGLLYTTSLVEYRQHDPKVQVVNGLGSYHEFLKAGFFPEHDGSYKVAIIHDEPAAYDFYSTSVWNRESVVNEMMSAFDAFVFVSSQCQEQWMELDELAGKSAFYLPNTCAEEDMIRQSLAAETRAECRTRLGYDDDVANLLVLATVQPRKAQHRVVEAVHALRSERPDLHIKLRLVGRHTQRAYAQELQEYVVEQGLGDVVDLVGEVDKEAALEHVRASDVLVLSSESEAMPLVLLEAMLLGTPIIAAPAGGVTEVVDESCAYLFDLDAPDSLKQQIVLALDDPARTAGLAALARERYDHQFSNETFFRRFDEVLSGILDARLVADTADEHFGSDATVSGLRSELRQNEDEGTVLSLRGQPTTRLSDVRTALARGGPIDSCSAVLDGATVDQALDLCAAFVRDGMTMTRLERTATGVEVDLRRWTARDDTFFLTHRNVRHDQILYGDLVRASRVRRGNPRAERELSAIKRSARYRLVNTLVRPFARMRVIRAAWRTSKSTVARARSLRNRHQPQTIAELPADTPLTPANVVVVNSPLQLMASTSLMDLRADDPSLPRVALVFSTSGSADFGERLALLARSSGNFDEVIEFTEIYQTVYESKVTFKRCISFKNQIKDVLGQYSAAEIYLPGFLSARAQKLLIEVFTGSTIRLYEDGVGSYVPKQIKHVDSGIVDRVGSGDCAEAHHIRLISSVDLMLDSIPVPPQYSSSAQRIRFPDVRVGDYAIDYERFQKEFGAVPRSFVPGSTLLLLQNFSDHLEAAGYTLDMEREMNDRMIRSLVAAGHRVVVRPHPRASAPMWSSSWDAAPNVDIWTDQPGLPVEVLIDYENPPASLVGISSSCLFYLSGVDGITAYRYPDESVDTLLSYCNDEFASALAIAVDVLQPVSLDTAQATTSGGPE